jgi:hypothetical protein
VAEAERFEVKPAEKREGDGKTGRPTPRDGAH